MSGACLADRPGQLVCGVGDGCVTGSRVSAQRLGSASGGTGSIVTRIYSGTRRTPGISRFDPLLNLDLSDFWERK